MNSGELILGSLVDFEGDIKVVDMVVGNSVGFDEGLTSIASVKGIKITEDILIRLGFTKWKDKRIYSKGGFMVYHHSKHGYCYGKSSNRTKLDYVHEIQALCKFLKKGDITLSVEPV